MADYQPNTTNGDARETHSQGFTPESPPSKEEERKARNRAKSKKYWDAHPEKREQRRERQRIKAKEWREANLERSRATAKASYQKDPEKFHARNRVWREKHPDRLNEHRKAWRERNRDKIRRLSRAAALKQLYGLSLDDYEQLIVSQSGRCAICKTPFDLLKTARPCVDHCHATGQVRGLLCQPCNKMLGYCKDNQSLFRAAIRYLKHHESEASRSRIGS